MLLTRTFRVAPCITLPIHTPVPVLPSFDQPHRMHSCDPSRTVHSMDSGVPSLSSSVRYLICDP